MPLDLSFNGHNRPSAIAAVTNSLYAVFDIRCLLTSQRWVLKKMAALALRANKSFSGFLAKLCWLLSIVHRGNLAALRRPRPRALRIADPIVTPVKLARQ